MKVYLLVALTLGISIPLSAQQSGEPIKGVIESTGTTSAHKILKTKPDQQATETEAIQGILAQITQIQQQHAQELSATKGQQNQDAKINGQIKTYTFWLVVVGAIQGLILVGTIIAISRQTMSAENAKRAWIMVEIDWDQNKVAAGTVFRGTGSSGDRTALYLVLSCKNEGESPAWIYEKRANFEIVKSLPPEPNLDGTEFLQVATEPIGTGKGALPHTTELSWDSQTKGHQQTGEMMVVYGTVKYRDIFSNRRTTRFGYRITPDMKLVRLENYPKYNQNT